MAIGSLLFRWRAAEQLGRPVVQKLHSATLTSNSCRALIVTTGKFSQDAENYAQSLTDIVVELIDMAKLAHMISVAFPNGALPTNLSVAIKTTPENSRQYSHRAFFPGAISARVNVLAPKHVPPSKP